MVPLSGTRHAERPPGTLAAALALPIVPRSGHETDVAASGVEHPPATDRSDDSFCPRSVVEVYLSFGDI